jgi:hypothetical protein
MTNTGGVLGFDRTGHYQNNVVRFEVALTHRAESELASSSQYHFRSWYCRL